jgi:hypothetical protein
MFGRYCLRALGLICLALPFTGCTSSGIDAITVSPTLTDFDGAGGNVQLTAIATIGHGSHPATYEDVTKQAAWSTPLAEVATVNSSGYVTVVGLGITPITASINGFTGVVSGSSTVCAEIVGGTNSTSCPTVSTTTWKTKTRLSLVQGIRTVSIPGEVVQLRVIGTSRDTGAQDDLTDGVIWTSSDESVATVSKSGLVTAVGRGAATIMATLTNEDKTAVAAATKFTVTGTGR